MKSNVVTVGVLCALLAYAFDIAGVGHAQPGVADPAVSRHVVDIRQLRFEPNELNVAEGDTIVWINRDVVPHTVSALEAEWDSGELKAGESWEWVARAGDSSRYYCEYHPTMRGRVTVRSGNRG